MYLYLILLIPKEILCFWNDLKIYLVTIYNGYPVNRIYKHVYLLGYSEVVCKLKKHL